MAYFPFYMDITDKVWTIVGGGKIAAHKIRLLAEFGAAMTVIAPAICKDIRQLERNHDSAYRLEVRIKEFEDADLLKADYVIAATDDKELNSHISGLCRRLHKPVNVVDVKEECSFIFPSIVKQENLVAAISTGGCCPALAVKLKRDLEAVIPDYYGTLNNLLGEYREYIRQRVPAWEARRSFYQELITLADSKGRCLTSEELRDRIDNR